MWKFKDIEIYTLKITLLITIGLKVLKITLKNVHEYEAEIFVTRQNPYLMPTKVTCYFLVTEHLEAAFKRNILQ